jgi:hypothetical protein
MPLPDRSNPYVGEMGMAYDMLQDAGIAPPWIEADKEARALLARRDALFERAEHSSSAMRRTAERELAGIVARYNDAADRVTAEAPTPRQHRSRLVLSDELCCLVGKPYAFRDCVLHAA